ncbi:hypothetical protein F5J12DRAFT_784837 [Pisolithus orientalis]|uniref:uncharacterized protein n=1 Tax=Pisolithus orientalis TaxID=936130 RepID=UPI002224A078|nr:uncharacterized protein F5J12DRAFT_784837 [Pisolithus orientalis]KAI5998489.1 hypothetical protein F5J12DRAFT_784837 [Pisolithus orientalis]
MACTTAPKERCSHWDMMPVENSCVGKTTKCALAGTNFPPIVVTLLPGLAFFKPKDVQYFAKILKEKDETQHSNSTLPVHKTAICQIMDKALDTNIYGDYSEKMAQMDQEDSVMNCGRRGSLDGPNSLFGIVYHVIYYISIRHGLGKWVYSAWGKPRFTLERGLLSLWEAPVLPRKQVYLAWGKPRFTWKAGLLSLGKAQVQPGKGVYLAWRKPNVDPSYPFI